MMQIVMTGEVRVAPCISSHLLAFFLSPCRPPCRKAVVLENTPFRGVFFRVREVEIRKL